MEENYLVHYGVLGMKWGIRKARKQGTEYQYKSHTQKRLEKKMTKVEREGKDSSKLRNKLEITKLRDAKRVKYAKETKTGSEIARRLLMGYFGARRYANLRAAGLGKFNSYMGSNLFSRRMEFDIAKHDIDRMTKRH